MVMNGQEWRNLLKHYRMIAVIRAQTVEMGLALAEAVAAGGVRLIEVTWNSDRPALLIERLRDRLPHCWIGAGTLLQPTDVTAAVAAGAQFGFMPHTHPELMSLAQTAGMPAIPGALTPTEIVTAWQAGASAVKVFPVTAMGGAHYIQQLQGPLGHIPLIPTGGVTGDNGAALLRAGAIAVGLSSSLFPAAAVAAHNWEAITQRAYDLNQQLQSYREPHPAVIPPPTALER
jgi:2-dehydro-3-deoxyphosphogluconate aldolase/(4S)-4-hydroxy-2-oxoglutarate aldolase